MTSAYRGSLKHKNRPATGIKGTLCPEWTHAAEGKGFGGDPHSHRWAETEAFKLFQNATIYGGRRYATARGIAFEAKPTGDGTWHGYPIPWESVPPSILGKWLTNKVVARQQMKLFQSRATDNIHWALASDD